MVLESVKGEVEYWEYIMDVASEEELQKLIKDIDETIPLLEKLKDKAETELRRRKEEELTPEEVEEEYGEEEEEIEKEIEVPYMTPEEFMSVALYKRIKEKGIENPRIEEKAKEVIEKYGLTEEQIEKIYNAVFGE